MRRALFTASIIFILAIYSPLRAAQFDNSLFDSVLTEHVLDGLVDYGGIKNDSTNLKAYLARLNSLDSVEYRGWSENEKKAFWINAYNAITIYSVVINYPIKSGSFLSRITSPKNSVKRIRGFWKKKYTAVMGKDISLDEIEHHILREKFHDPRIHFALVCASLGCPKLRSHPYNPDSLDKQLDAAALEFIKTKGVVIDSVNNKLYISKIFDWYADDFQYPETPLYLAYYDREYRGFMKFVIDHLGYQMERYIRNNAPEMKFVEYDWTINELK